jgi:hypothetical protein
MGDTSQNYKPHTNTNTINKTTYKPFNKPPDPSLTFKYSEKKILVGKHTGLIALKITKN